MVTVRVIEFRRATPITFEEYDEFLRQRFYKGWIECDKIEYIIRSLAIIVRGYREDRLILSVILYRPVLITFSSTARKKSYSHNS